MLVEWTDFDAEHSLAASDALIQQYLSRTYRNPLREYRDIKFELLKCLDLYHSKELAQHVNRYVGRTRAKAGSK